MPTSYDQQRQRLIEALLQVKMVAYHFPNGRYPVEQSADIRGALEYAEGGIMLSLSRLEEAEKCATLKMDGENSLNTQSIQIPVKAPHNQPSL